MLASYTISEELNNYNSFSGAGEAYSSNFIQNIELNKTPKTLGVNDRQQTFTACWVYELPFGPGKRFSEDIRTCARFPLRLLTLPATRRRYRMCEAALISVRTSHSRNCSR